MLNHRMISFIGIALIAATVPVLSGQETDPEVLILRARAVLQTPDAGREAITKALGDALSASLLILPKTASGKELRSRIEGVRETLDHGQLFSDRAYQELNAAYKLVSGGKAWQIPEELKAPGGAGAAAKVCAKLLDSALAGIKAGRNEKAASDLLGFVILVVTPIES